MGVPNPEYYSRNTNPRNVYQDERPSDTELMMKRHEMKMWQAVKGLRNLPIVPLDFMYTNLIPDSGVDVEATKKNLEMDGTLCASGWKDFGPSHTSGYAFSAMHEIQNKIISSAAFLDGALRDPTFTMLSKPTFAPISPTNARIGPDGCGQFTPSNPLYHPGAIGEHSWFNTPYVEEYEDAQSEDQMKNNVKKMLWTVEHLMNEDHRRRFVFGLTIEGTDTRIWFFCRQTIFASASFDFMKEPEHFIRTISSLAYASPIQLGFDPTIELIQHDGHWNYRITIVGPDSAGTPETKTYQTTNMLSDHADKIRGRATRIYDAYDVDDEAKTPVVIKDSWIDAKRPFEGDTLRAALEGACDEERAFFLTVLQHGVVKILGQPDHTRNLILRGYDITLEHQFERRGRRTSRQKRVFSKLVPRRYYTASGQLVEEELDTMLYEADIIEVHPTPDLELRTGVEYDPQVHYRLVFREKGVSLRDVCRKGDATLSIVLTAMRDVIRALGVMWKNKYVHRDVSPANIIIYNGRARLSDLEFATSYGTVSPFHDDNRTGTYDFMAVEVLRGRCIRNAGIYVIHNPLHDLESVWWIGVWCLFCHYSPNAALTDPEIRGHVEDLQMIKYHLFSSCSDPFSRTRMEHAMSGRFAQLPSAPFSRPLRRFFVVLEQMRAELYNRLEEAENKFPIDIASFESPDFFSTIHDFLDTDDDLAMDENLWPIYAIQKRQNALVVGKLVVNDSS